MKENRMIFCSMCGYLDVEENYHKEDGKLYCDFCLIRKEEEKEPLLYKMDNEYYAYCPDYEALEQFCRDGNFENINDLVLHTGLQADRFIGKWFLLVHGRVYMKEGQVEDYGYTQEEKIKIGAYLASTFMLHKSPNHKDRYSTHWGSKTALGVFETFLRVGKELQTGTFKFKMFK